VQSPPSGHFSHIPHSSRTEVHSDSEESPAYGHFGLPASPQTPEPEPSPHPYPDVIIDARTHRVTLTSEAKPSNSEDARSPSTSPPPASQPHASSSTGAIPAIVAGAAAVVSSSSTPASTSQVKVSSQSVPASSSVPNASTGSSNLLTEKTFTHKSSRSGSGPSMFEKVRSKTRPTFLPPKSRREDDKHMADWQQMMKQSRLAGKSTPAGPGVSR
jgi:hypothetical protein